MGDAQIPVDLFNPGQVFGCIGLVEAADVLLGEGAGSFDWSNDADVRFRIRAAGDACPVGVVLDFLLSASVRSLAPAGSSNSTDDWHVPTRILGEGEAFPYPDPPSPATLPITLEGEVSGARAVLSIDHWGDERGGEMRRDDERRDPVKFWGGGAGYPGAALARDALDLVRRAIGSDPDRQGWTAAIADPFNVSAEQSSSFRFDWRRDYVPIDVGFSVNSQKGRIVTVGFPIVELLAAIGLGNARPERINKLEYRYAAASGEGDLLDLTLLRAGLGGADLPLPRRCFRMHLAYPGKEGQARVISTVTEEEATR